MSRNDLTQKEETWSEAALAGGDFSKYANLFADDENDKKLRAGLATIERLDRELAKVHAFNVKTYSPAKWAARSK